MKRKKKIPQIIVDDQRPNYGWKPIHKNSMWKYVFPIIVIFCFIVPLLGILFDFFECGLFKC